MIERFNMRGVTSRGFFEGGAQERSLAQEYETWAGKVRVKWPRSAAVLETIAKSWREDARREDIRAEQTGLEG
jgi:hypothetical protein